MFCLPRPLLLLLTLGASTVLLRAQDLPDAPTNPPDGTPVDGGIQPPTGSPTFAQVLIVPPPEGSGLDPMMTVFHSPGIGAFGGWEMSTDLVTWTELTTPKTESEDVISYTLTLADDAQVYIRWQEKTPEG